MARYRVRVPYVTCRSEEAARLLPPPWNKQATAVSGYTAGSVLPPSVPADEIERMVGAHLIEEIPE